MPAPLSDAAAREYHAAGYYLAKGFFDVVFVELGLPACKAAPQPAGSSSSNG